ncbi:tetrahydromethanopterin S-methyltransferase subunit H family protein, partial [Desulfofundulus thermocisternus]|uniref:tetrahydromethanopterin S-methyltransferase subunit H family protein n=1 Tax=Desulfofundulus thermocisternus TaxID=42471 RepID=UPI000485AB8A
MFKLSRPQRVCRIGRWNIGGQPGENSPLLISSMFHNGDRILESRKERKFDREKAKEYVKRQEELSAQTGIPALVAMVATSVDEMKTYIDFFLSISDQPFGIDVWVEKTRLEVAEYIARLGIQDRVLYNSITPWDKDIPGQVARLKELGIKHVVVQAFNQEDQTPKGRVTGLKKMLDIIGEDTFETILVDTAVMNLPSTSFSCIACRLVKEEFGWPAGVASSNGTYMWKAAREMWGSEGFNAMNAAGQAIAALLWSDLLFSGPIV